MAQYFTHHQQSVGTGDTVRVHQEIEESGKTRVQVFEGIVIAIKNAGRGQTFTVRRTAVGGVGVERILPVHLPSIKQVEVLRKGKVRRAKLYYLRDRVGKAATRIKEQATGKRAKPANGAKKTDESSAKSSAKNKPAKSPTKAAAAKH